MIMLYKILGVGTKRKYNFHNKAIKSSEYAYDAITYSIFYARTLIVSLPTTKLLTLQDMLMI